MNPWMDSKEIELIEKHLTPNTVMLEWGSGGSTIYFSKKVKKLISIEHTKKYFDIVSSFELPNVEIYYVPTNKLPNPNELDSDVYKDYINKPNELGIKFDVILIDGRARYECSKISLKLIKDDGIVFSHDFWHKNRINRDIRMLEFYEEIESIKDTKQTIILMRKK